MSSNKAASSISKWGRFHLLQDGWRRRILRGSGKSFGVEAGDGIDQEWTVQPLEVTDEGWNGLQGSLYST